MSIWNKSAGRTLHQAGGSQMKSLTIFALVTVLALGLTLSASAQTQSENPSSDQYTTQSTDQTTTTTTQTTETYSAPASPDDSAAMSTDMSFDKDALATRGDRRESQQDIDYLQELQNDSGAN
jgi:hypothetical protein